MRNALYRLLVCLATCALAFCGEESYEGTANIVMKNGSVFKNQRILVDSLDAFTYSSAEGMSASIRRGDFTVEYLDPTAGASEWHRANLDVKNGKLNEAASKYVVAVVNLRERGNGYWAREAALRAARLYIDLNRPDEALNVLAQLESTWPRATTIAESRFLRGSALVLKKDFAAAKKLFEELLGKEKEWGAGAPILGVNGLAKMHRADGKPAEAAAVVLPVLQRIAPASQPQVWGSLAVECARDLNASGKADDAIALLRSAVLKEVGQDLQSELRLSLGKLLVAKGDQAANLMDAIDQFAIAYALSGGDQAARSEAAKEGRNACDKLAKDASLSEDIKRDYRVMAGNF